MLRSVSVDSFGRCDRILVSTGYGAGWSTGYQMISGKEIAEYRPIIDFIESGSSRGFIPKWPSP